MKRNLAISLQLIKYSPIIIYRYFKYLILKKRLLIQEFRPNNNYCIEDSLNQLIWNVENNLFSILENNSKVYLSSGDFIFKISKENTQFILKSYGYNKTIKSYTKIQVIALQQKSFDSNILIKKIPLLKKYNTKFKIPANTNIRLQKINSLSTIQIEPFIIHDRLNNLELTTLKEPIKELTDIDNLKTIDQINNHHYE